MIEGNYVEIDGKSYVEADIIEVKGNNYAVLVNTKDEEDFIIKKIVKENNEEFYDPIENDKIYYQVLLKFAKKHADLLKDL